MDENKKAVMEKRIEKTMANLAKNKMKPYYAKDKQEALQLVESLLQEGQTIACGGSMTLEECGIMQLLRSGKYNFLDRAKPGLTPQDITEIYRKAFFADNYLLSANAITENGELYNVDGNSNRVAALAFGPSSVIVVAGYNKIVPDIDAAVERVKKTAAPANAIRLHCATPCAKVGECMDCHGDGRICCNYLVSAQQRHQDRIKVILVGEELGY